MLLSFGPEAAALDRVRTRDLVGEIGGVLFDLRHPAIDPAVLENTSWGFFETWFAFPWDREAEAAPSDEIGPLESEAGELPRFPVQSGDEIVIERVEPFLRGEGPLADPHDNEERWAYVVVRRAGSVIHAVEEPMAFVPRGALGPHSPHSSAVYDDDYAQWVENHQVTYDKLSLRIDRLAAGAAAAGVDREWLRLAQDMREQTQSLRTHAPQELEDLVADLLDLTATAGYALARAEASRLSPLAERGRRAKRDHAAATEAARIANLKPDTVRLIAQAEAMGRGNPNLSLNACATALAGQFGRDPKNVRDSIRHLFVQRTRPNGQVEYRPKRPG